MIGIMVRKGEKKNRSKEVAIDQAGTDVCAFQFVEAEQIAFLRDASILQHACSFDFVPKFNSFIAFIDFLLALLVLVLSFRLRQPNQCSSCTAGSEMVRGA